MRLGAILLTIFVIGSLPPAASAAGDGARPDPVETVLGFASPRGRQFALSCGNLYEVCKDQCYDRYVGCRGVQSDSVCWPRFRGCMSACFDRHC